jgi:hypothetical protein
MPKSDPAETVTIAVPKVSGEEAAAATDLVEHLVEKYSLSTVDADTLFNAMVTIFVRGKIACGDQQPSRCSLGDLLADEQPKKNN